MFCHTVQSLLKYTAWHILAHMRSKVQLCLGYNKFIPFMMHLYRTLYLIVSRCSCGHVMMFDLCKQQV